MPSITVREFHPESGALLGNISTLKFGKITSGTTSRVKVIDIAFSELSAVDNLKIGLISSGGLAINSNPTDIASDGSSSTGNFGIEDTSAFDSVKAASPLTRHFAGLNSTITASDSNNVSVGKRNATVSNYIYLDIEIGSSDVDAGNGSYKVFFDYS